jgi:hypothetical protein
MNPRKDSQPKKEIYIQRIDFENDPPTVISIPKDIHDLLAISEKQLNLPRPAQQIFDGQGRPIDSIDRIEPNMNIFISCSKPYKDPALRKSIPEKQVLKTKKTIIYSQRPIYDNPKYRNLISSSSYSLGEIIQQAIIGLFDSFSLQQQQHLKFYQELQQIHTNSQISIVQQSLLSQFIGESSFKLDPEIEAQVVSWCSSQIKKLNFRSLRFTIYGATQSGKSTILHIFSTLITARLIVLDEIANYLIIPINWKIAKSCVHSTRELFVLFLDSCITALKSARPSIIPLCPFLRDYLLSASTSSSLLSLPSQLAHFPKFPGERVISLGQLVSGIFSHGTTEAIIDKIAQLPNFIAQTFRMKDTFFIFDNFDATSDTSETQKTSPLQISLSKALLSSPFLVAATNISSFAQLYESEDVISLFTEHIISMPTLRAIQATVGKFASIILTWEMCSGTPGFCALFKRISALIEGLEPKRNSPITPKYRSKASMTRLLLAKHELSKLLLLIYKETEEIEEIDVSYLRNSVDPEIVFL